MTKTAYAKRMTAEQFAARTKDMTPKEREEERIDQAINPLFDMWLRFEEAFARRAIDKLDVTDEDAEACAVKMEQTSTASGAAFAYLLRRIRVERITRMLSHRASAIWAFSGAPEALRLDEINERYEKLPKGDA